MSSGAKQPKQPAQTTQTAENAPWKGVQPHLLGLYNMAQQQANTPQQFFPGQTYANMSPQTIGALSAISNQANAGTSPLYDQAAGYAQNVLGGQYLNSSNPYDAQVAQSVGDDVQQQLASRFAGSGRAMGSPGETQQFSRDMANTLAPLRYSDASQRYAMERGFQQNAAQMLPSIAQAQTGDQWRNLMALQGVGQAYDLQAQKGIDEAMARHDFGQQEAQQRLAQYAQLLGAGSPFTSQTSQTSQRQPGGGAGTGAMVGSGLMGAGTGAATGMMIGGPWGAAAGGLLGLGAGFFSDRRLKRDIRRIGTGRWGLPVYQFRYLWSPTLHVGFMADEVLRVSPHAVGIFLGFLYVRYAEV